MRKTLFALILLAATLSAHAELYKWVDSSGKVQYSDQPPPNANAKSIGRVKGKSPVASVTETKAGSKATPKTLADKEMEFNKRRQEAKESAAKKDKEATAAKEKQENCTRARTALRALQEGGRMSTTDDKGERVIMDDTMRQRETERAKKDADSWCK
jgi:Skp family chaperone for outer membrane proteins